MRRILRGLIEYNLLVSLVALGLALSTCRLLGISIDPGGFVMLAAGTFLVYGLDRRLPFSHEDRHVPEPRNAPSSAVLWVAGAICLAALSQLERAAQGVACGLGTIGALYVLPLLPGRRRLKEIPYLKCFLVALGWSISCVLLPVKASTVSALIGNREVVALMAYRFVLLLPNLLLADWPDRAADRSVGIRTLANRVGERTLRGLCIAISLASLAACYCLSAKVGFPFWIGIEMLLPIACMALLLRPLPESRAYYAGWMDALLLWPGILALLVTLR